MRATLFGPHTALFRECSQRGVLVGAAHYLADNTARKRPKPKRFVAGKVSPAQASRCRRASGTADVGLFFHEGLFTSEMDILGRMVLARVLLFAISLALRLVSAARGPGWGVVSSALQRYQTLVGDINRVPYSFVIPPDSSWAPETHGLKLGQIVSRIRNRNDFSAHAKELDEFGLNRIRDREWVDLNQFAESLSWYQNQFSSSSIPLIVPSKFKLPLDTSVPAHLNGYPLGTKFSKWLQQRNQQDEEFLKSVLLPGTVLPSGPLRVRCSPTTLLSALRSYQAAFGNLEIAHSYICTGPFYAEDCQGLRLGHRVAHIRNRGSYSDIREMIDDVGVFPWIVSRDKELLSILDDLVKKYGRDLSTASRIT